MANISRIDKLNNLQTPKSEKQSIREYFEEMDLPLDEIEERITIANDLDAVFNRLFLIFLALASLGKDIDRDYYITFLTQEITDVLSVNGIDVINSYIDDYINKIAIEIIDTTLKNTSSFFTSSQRAENLARDISNAVNNYKRDEQAIADGYTKKVWKTKLDMRVRKTHIHADGQTVPIMTPFSVGEYELMFPLDTSLGAGAEEIANCRCVCEYIK